MKSQFQSNKKYFTISIYVIVVTLICAFILKAVIELGSTISLLKSLFHSLSPFLIGFFIAYLMTPFVDAIYNKVLSKLFRSRQQVLCRLLSIFIAYIIIITLLIGLLVYIVPNIVNNLSEIVVMCQSLYTKLISYIDVLALKYPNIDLDYVRSSITSSFPSFMTAFTDFVSKFAPVIYGTSISVLRWILNFIIAIIVSCYMLIDKHMMTRSAKRIIYAFLKKERADFIWNTLKRSNQVFSGFIVGKTIDSLIIGGICFIVLLILKMPFALLVSVVVCVTNMIPYFGPFIGAIPSAIIILLVSPPKAIAFVIFIIILQQIDGNIIGPRILGESTGLRPLWIIFAISVGGWCAGVLGMFLGVPCVAVISSLLDDAVSARLNEKNIDMPMIQNAKIRKNKTKKDSNEK